MKKILLGLLLLASPALAKTSAKLTGEMGYQIRAEKIPAPTVGLGLYQSLGKKFAYNSWTGLGHQARINEPQVQWIATKHDLIYYYGITELALQYAYKTASQETLSVLEDEHKVSLKVSVKLF